MRERLSLERLTPKNLAQYNLKVDGKSTKQCKRNSLRKRYNQDPIMHGNFATKLDIA